MKKLHQNLSYRRHSSPTFQQILHTILVKDVLQDYGIQKDHVLCIVTDPMRQYGEYVQTSQ